MTQTERIAIALKGAYLHGRCQESQEVKSFIAHSIREYKLRGFDKTAQALQSILASLSQREHSQTRLPPPGDNQ